MSECFRKVFILNNEVLNCNEFNSGLIYFGESIYEVIRISGGVPFFLDDHLGRLFQTAELRKRKLWLDKKEIESKINQVIELNNEKQGNIKLVFNYPAPGLNTGNFLVYFIEHHYPTNEQEETGVSTILYFAEREFPAAKIINQALRSVIFKKLIDMHAYEALLVNNEGYITEGSRSNVFFTKNDMIYTASSGEVLPGIARKYILEVCRNIGVKVNFEKVHSERIFDYNGVFLSGTSPGVLPVSCINDVKFDPHCNTILKIRDSYRKVSGR